MKDKDRARMEILLEEVRDKVNKIAEGHDILLREIQRTRNDLSGRIDLVELAIKNLSGRVGNLKIGQRNLEIGLLEVKAEIKKIHFRLDDHEAKLN